VFVVRSRTLFWGNIKMLDYQAVLLNFFYYLQRSIIFSLFLICFSPNAARASDTPVSNLIQSLMSCHPELRASALRVELAGVALQQVDAGRLPSFSVTADGFTQNGTQTAQLQLNATVPIATFGVLPAKKELEEARLELQRIVHAKEVRSHAERLISLTLSQFYLDEKILLVEDVLASQSELGEQMQRQLAKGNSSKADLLQVNSSISQTNSKLNSLLMESYRNEQEIQTLECLGYDSKQIIAEIQPFVQSYVGSTIYSFEFLEAERKAVVIKNELNLERLSNRPTIQLEGSAALTNNGTTSPRFGLSSKYEYQNLGRSSELSLQEKELQLQEAALNVEKVKQEQEQRLLILEKELSFLATQAVPQRQASILNLKEERLSSRRLFDAGRIRMNELLSAYDELSNAQINLIDLRKQLDLLYVEKFFLLGGG